MRTFHPDSNSSYHIQCRVLRKRHHHYHHHYHLHLHLCTLLLHVVAHARFKVWHSQVNQVSEISSHVGIIEIGSKLPTKTMFWNLLH